MQPHIGNVLLPTLGSRYLCQVGGLEIILLLVLISQRQDTQWQTSDEKERTAKV